MKKTLLALLAMAGLIMALNHLNTKAEEESSLDDQWIACIDECSDELEADKCMDDCDETYKTGN